MSEQTLEPGNGGGFIITRSFVLWALFASCLVGFVALVGIGWGNPILDRHGFRQAQTAITVDYFVRQGVSINYETPVLGFPWQIPMEFPTYQAVVSKVVTATGMNIDQAGRLVSVAFAIAAFVGLLLFVRDLTGSVAAGVFTVGLCMASPLYIFYSRAFMLESTALFFAVGMLLFGQRALARLGWRDICLFMFFGLMAGLTKATTYGIAVVLLGVMVLLRFRARLQWAPMLHPGTRPRVLGLLTAAVLPFLAALLWVWYADLVKGRNELGQFLQSGPMATWNYGTLAQRFSLSTWTAVFEHIDRYLIGTPLVWVLAMAVLSTARVPTNVMVVLLVGFAAGPLAFTNLFKVHEYYYYASGVYLFSLLGTGLGAIWDKGGPRHSLAAIACFASMSGLMLAGYRANLHEYQKNCAPPLITLAGKVAELTNPSDVLLIEGFSWDSSLPYYSHRRAIMNQAQLSADDPKLRRAIDRLPRPLGAVVVGPSLKENKPEVQRKLERLGFQGEPRYTSAEGDIYLPLGAGNPQQPAN